jgi:prepilin-type N-terminal cleavage/methylation domain-containing protein
MTVKESGPMHHKLSDPVYGDHGFSLIETMIALFILTFGLLATGQALYTAARLGNLARSKSTAAVAAQSTLEFLADLYKKNPSADELSPGSHGPILQEAVNPVNSQVLNRFSISWNSEVLPNCNPLRSAQAKIVRVKVTPILLTADEAAPPNQNKTLTVSTLIIPEIP